VPDCFCCGTVFDFRRRKARERLRQNLGAKRANNNAQLCLGKIGYIEILRLHGFDMARVQQALAIYGL